MSFAERWQEVRTGFQPCFWVANGTELFERLSFYSQQAVLAIFLNEELGLSKVETGWLMGFYGFVAFFLPVLGGALVDRYGFRRALASAYLVLTAGYFLLGSLSAPWMAGLRAALPMKWLLFAILLVAALGPGLVKPSVVGTTALASGEKVRSLGFSIYYTLVNIGGWLGPNVAFLVRRSVGIENVFRVAALSVFLMFWVTLLLYREPEAAASREKTTLAKTLGNMFLVLGNLRFILFLLIFSGFWVLFWQLYIGMPLYVRGYIDPNAPVDLISQVDAAMIILFQVLITYATRKIPAFPAMTLGILVAALSMLVFSLAHSVWVVVLALMVLGLGEMMQAPRYYEYVSSLAPRGQEGLFMGYAFVPIAVGYLIAGPLGGWLVHYFGEVQGRPEWMWLVLAAIGFVTTVLMWVYNKVLAPGKTRPAQA